MKFNNLLATSLFCEIKESKRHYGNMCRLKINYAKEDRCVLWDKIDIRIRRVYRDVIERRV